MPTQRSLHHKWKHIFSEDVRRCTTENDLIDLDIQFVACGLKLLKEGIKYIRWLQMVEANKTWVLHSCK